MIRFPNLLRDHSAFSVFWKTLLERLSINDAPYFSLIETRADSSLLQIEGKHIDLAREPRAVVDFCRAAWGIPQPIDSWRNIKKESVRLYLLQDFLARNDVHPNYILKLQMAISDKVIANDDIVLEDGQIVEIKTFEELT